MKKQFLLLIFAAIILTGVQLTVAANLAAQIESNDKDSDSYNSAIDCNDNNASVWNKVLAYVDNDLDGVGSGGYVEISIGDYIPSGYVNSTAMHNDCNDSDFSVWQYLSGYSDLDGDGFGKDNLTQLCTGEKLPSGYADNNEDCDDNDSEINPNSDDIVNDEIDQNCDGFDNTDSDLDGYFRFNLDSTLKDCDDTNGDIHPGAAESCNGVDDDCDKYIDEDYPDKSDTCYVGIGECMTDGKMVCNSFENGTFCRGVAGKSQEEICDNLDNDCDNETDEDGVCDSQEEYKLNIISPDETVFFFKTKKINLLLNTSYTASLISYIETSSAKPKETSLCKKCSKVNKKIQFSEGEHNLTINAIINNVLITKNLSFFIDSKNPKIYSPKILYKGYTNGTGLNINYSEINLANVSILYTIGNGKVEELTRTDCRSGEKQSCSFDLDLSSEEGNEITYFFRVTDIVGNYADSKKVTAIIDTTPPEITNPDSLFTVYSNRVFFTVNVSETNFKDVSYYDPAEKNPKWRILCSRLKNNSCEKMQVFKPGEHEITLKITDKAGNYQEIKI